MRLRQQQVEEPPSRAGRAFDELQIFGAEHHGAQHAEIIGQPPHGTAVERQAAFSGGPVHLDVVFALPDTRSADEITFLPMPHHVRAADAAEGSQGGEEINGFEHVGLALRVVAEQQVESGREIHVEPRVIAEVTQT